MNDRESIRWRTHDYRCAGAYFVTACAQDRDPLFGEVRDGEMMFNEAGRAVCDVWREIPARFRGVTLDEWILMPDHFHGLVVISELRRRRTTWPTLGEVVAAFKSRSTVEYIRGVRLHGWKPFRGRLWQRNYFERVGRDQTEMDLARAYIRTNPQRHDQNRDDPSNRYRPIVGATLVVALTTPDFANNPNGRQQTPQRLYP